MQPPSDHNSDMPNDMQYRDLLSTQIEGHPKGIHEPPCHDSRKRTALQALQQCLNRQHADPPRRQREQRARAIRPVPP